MMDATYQIPLSVLIKEHNLEEIYLPAPAKDISIYNPEIDRPALALTGFYEMYEASRIQLIGKAEHTYLDMLEPEERAYRLKQYMHMRPICVLFTTGLEVYPEMIEAAKEEGVPILRTQEKTSATMAAVIASLNRHLAPRITRHGVLVEVYGEGLLLLGDSGVGKSETAIELVKRGHRLIADDAVEIKRVSAITLIGSAPEIIRHYVEIRGVGIIEVQKLFGMGAVQFETEIDLVIQLEPWVEGKFYDRLGLGEDSYTMLGISLPYVTIPVRPGRNLAGIVEIATMKNRQMKYGENSALNFVEQFDRRVDNMVNQARGNG